MKILLLGYKGNLGSAIMRITNDNYEVVAWESSELNFDNSEEIIEKIGALAPDVLINTMAYNAVDNCETDEGEYEKAKKLNILLPKILAEACINSNTILVHYSSDYVFGAYVGNELAAVKTQGGFSEEDIPKTNSRYSESKLSGEKEIVDLASKNLKYYIIRTSKLFGQKGNSEFAKPSFFDTMLSLCEKNNELKVVDAEMSCFTYTPDLAKATIELVISNNPWGIYHIVNEGACTWYDGAVKLFNLAKKNVKIIPVDSNVFPRPAKRPEYSVLKNTKLNKLRNFEDALAEYLESIN